LSGGSDVRSLRSAFVEVHEELEAKFPDYEAQSKEHSRIAQVHAVCRPTTLTYIHQLPAVVCRDQYYNCLRLTVRCLHSVMVV